MNKFIFLVLFLFQPVYSADLVISQEAQDQLDSVLARDGRATVIVGLSESNTAESQPASSIKCSKNRFLRSMPVVKSIASQSMQVIDELENLPFVVINVDAKGLNELKNHPHVVSIEADFPVKLQ